MEAHRHPHTQVTFWLQGWSFVGQSRLMLKALSGGGNGNLTLKALKDVTSPQFPSWMAKNYRATMKTRYCGRLYSSLLRKWTWWGHRDQVSYYMEGGLKGTEGSPPRAGWGPCRSPGKHFTLVGLPYGFALMGLVATVRWPVVSPC